MPRLRTNFVKGTLTASLTSSATTMSSSGLAGLPPVASPDYALISLDPDGINGTPEIVKVTAHSASATTATIVRGQEGTSARSHAAASAWVHGPVASDFSGSDARTEAFNDIGNSGGSFTVDFALGNVQKVTLTANASVTFAGATSGEAASFTLYVFQDATGGRTLTWPASVDWPSGLAPTLSTAAGAVDVFVFQSFDGGTTWYGFAAGQGMA